MDKELTGWDKVGATIRKKAVLSAHRGRKPLSKKLLNTLREGVLGKNTELKPPKDWVNERPDIEELVGKVL